MSSLDEYLRMSKLNKRELKKELRKARKENNELNKGYLEYLIWKK